MADIKVTSQDLHTVAGQLSAGSADIESRLTQLHAQVQGLVDNGWTGSASGAFSELYQQWHTSAGQLKQALDGIGRQLTGAATAYEQT
jgi:WXG100 family type VII secretion target